MYIKSGNATTRNATESSGYLALLSSIVNRLITRYTNYF